MRIRRVDAISSQAFDDLCALLRDAVDGGASVGFLAPISRETCAAYWKSVAKALDAGLLLYVAEENGRIVGGVQLSPCSKENGRHRAEIQKLFVLGAWRGRGLASALMGAAEDAARALGITLLILDTHEGSHAEAVYGHLGWTRAGVIPDYAMTTSGTLHGTTFFYKRLSPAST